MSIDPRFAFWFGVWTSILLLIASGTISFEGALPAVYVPPITKWCAILGAINSTILTAASGYSSNKLGPMVSAPIAPSVNTVAKILIAAFVLSMFLASDRPAHAQFKTPAQIAQDIDAKLRKTNAGVQSAVTGQPAADSSTALPCDFKMLTKLTPENLVPTVKACLSDANSKLVSDTQRALDSAKSYGGSASATGTTGTTTAAGDGDGVNCLTPALAIFKAGVQIPGIPAVTAADGTVTTPAVPAQDPGPILLYQKYREFTLAGGLTACQAWFNGPINATTAAGIAGAGTALAGAALLAPK